MKTDDDDARRHGCRWEPTCAELQAYWLKLARNCTDPELADELRELAVVEGQTAIIMREAARRLIRPELSRQVDEQGFGLRMHRGTELDREARIVRADICVPAPPLIRVELDPEWELEP